MFGLGGQELIIILLIALLFFGAKKLPELARGLGKSINEFKRAQTGLEEEFNKSLEEDSVEDKVKKMSPEEREKLSELLKSSKK
ncbi:MAG: twin-arginine translocase TatA/TatE family subunit [Chloroherpetonaceae bacterium]|nr:twin-arginine translocase TatA/TatE family subunit [Chloroherpetonaceae bacterium]